MYLSIKMLFNNLIFNNLIGWLVNTGGILWDREEVGHSA